MTEQPREPRGPRRQEKEEEKREKDDEKRGEKDRGWDEKWHHNPARAVVFAAILIWGGIVAIISTAGLVNAAWWQGWAVFFVGTAVILFIKAAFRLMPGYRRPVGGTIVIALVLLGIGLGDIVGWSYVWPIVIIVIGLLIISRAFGRR